MIHPTSKWPRLQLSEGRGLATQASVTALSEAISGTTLEVAGWRTVSVPDCSGKATVSSVSPCSKLLPLVPVLRRAQPTSPRCISVGRWGRPSADDSMEIWHNDKPSLPPLEQLSCGPVEETS